MEQSVHRIVLDLRDIHNPRHLDVKQGDTGVRLCVALTDGGKPYRLTPDCYGVFTAKKPDGTCIFNRCTTENGRLVYDFTPQTTAAPGDLDCQLKLYGKNDQLLTTAAFTVTVHETVYNEGDTLASETEVTALTQLISQTTDLVDTVQTKLETGEFHGKTPHIGANGNWWLGETDTGTAADALDDSQVSEATTWSSRKLQNTFVRTDAAQALTQAQMAQARENIGAISQAQAVNAQQLQDAVKDLVKLETAPVVRYDKSQYLPVEQARKARRNIGAAIEGPAGDVVSRGVHIYENNIVENDEAYYTDAFLRSAVEDDKTPVLRVFSAGRENYIKPDEYWDYHESGDDTILRGIAPGRNDNDAVTKKQLEEAIAAGGAVTGAVRYDEAQELTDEQKEQARENIGVSHFGIDDVVSGLENREVLTKGIETRGLHIIDAKNLHSVSVHCKGEIWAGDGKNIASLLSLTPGWSDGVVIRGLLPGAEDTDAVNVKQFNDALGDVESALDGIIALQNSLIGGGSV